MFLTSGVAMMFIGLINSDITYTKFSYPGGLFASICGLYFDLAIAGLGKNTGKASSFNHDDLVV
jgi:FHS family L-fucose permease-like MFS transporter